MTKLTPQQQTLENAVKNLAQVLSDVVPAGSDNPVVEDFKFAILKFYVAKPVETYDVKSRETAIALGEENDEG